MPCVRGRQRPSGGRDRWAASRGCTSGRDAQTAAPEDSGGRAIFEAADDSVDIDCEDGAEPGSEWRVTLTKAGTPAGLGIETGNGQFVVNLVKPHGRTAEHN